MMKLITLFLLFIGSSSLLSSENRINIDFTFGYKKIEFVSHFKNIEFDKEYTKKLDGHLIKYKIKSLSMSSDIEKESFEIQTEIFKGGKLLTTGKIITKLNSRAKILKTNEGNKTYVTFTPREAIYKRTSRHKIGRPETRKVTTILPIETKPASEAKPLIEKLLTENGEIKIDKKTNSLIVKDEISNILKLKKIYADIIND